MTACSLPLAIHLLLAVLLPTLTNDAALPEAQLREKLPHVTLDNKAFKSFQMSGTLSGGPVASRFAVMVDTEHNMGICIKDSNDATPYFVVAGRHTLLYDALRNQVFVGDNHAASFAMRCVPDGTFDLHWNVDLVQKSELDVDIKSIFSNLAVKVTRPPDGSYMLIGRSTKGVKYTAQLQPEKSCPVSRFEITMPSRQEPVLLVDRFVCDQPGTVATVFPSERDLERHHLHVKPYSELVLSDVEFISATPLFHAALQDPALRIGLQKKFGDINWDAAKKKYMDSSTSVRELVREFKLGVD